MILKLLRFTACAFFCHVSLFAQTTQIKETQCGTTLPSISTLIAATCIPDATAFRFEVTDTRTGTIQTIDRSLHYFSLAMLPQYDYARTYSVRVELQVSGEWTGSFGPSCLVSSPAILAPDGAAQLLESQCGARLTAIGSLIATRGIAAVTGYRFRITNISNPNSENVVQTIDRSVQWFALTMLPEYSYGTSYLVEVAVKTTGGYSDFGSPCIVVAPEVPGIAGCGSINLNPAGAITTSSLAKVSMYRFEISNMETMESVTIDRPQHWFTFSQIPGYIPGAAYGVRVAVMTAGTFSDFGDACEITAPGTGRFSEEDEKQMVAKAYPNPFSETFAIDTDAAVRIYDMTGRMVEEHPTAGGNLGQSLSSGVYTVVAGTHVQRIVKR